MRAWVLLWLAMVSPLMAEDRTAVAADFDTREGQLENLYADYWRTESESQWETKISRHGSSKNKLGPWSRTRSFCGSWIASAFPLGS